MGKGDDQYGRSAAERQQAAQQQQLIQNQVNAALAAERAKAPVPAAQPIKAQPIKTQQDLVRTQQMAPVNRYDQRISQLRQQGDTQMKTMSPQDIAAMRQQFFQQRRGTMQGDIERERAKLGAELGQGIRQQQQEAGDALTRRFAALGQGSSGAALAAQQKLNEQGLMAQNKLQQQLQDVGRGQIDQLDAAEREAALQQGMSELQLGRQEAMGSRDEALKLALAGADEQFKREVFGEERMNKLKEFELALQQLEIDKDVTEFNKRMAEITAGQNAQAARGGGGGLISNLLGGLL